MSDLPLIVDVKRHSLEDGSGIRSVVFFKGCPLHCIFCQNPEAQNPQAEIAFFAIECILCGKCADACDQGAINLKSPPRIRRDKCIRCGSCADACPTKSLRLIGTYYPPEALTEILLRDEAFYRHSGGGVTLSGGEPTLYPDYLSSLLKLLKRKDIHIVLETSGYFDYPTFKHQVLPYLDLVYYDIKFAYPQTHKQYTGKHNRKILDNFRSLVEEGEASVHPRIPIIPQVTATRENLTAIVGFLCSVGAESVSLLPYNPMGMEMYVSLGRTKPNLPEGFMQPEGEREVYALFEEILEEKRWRGERKGAGVKAGE